MNQLGQFLLSKTPRPPHLEDAKPDVASNVVKFIGVQVPVGDDEWAEKYSKS